MANIRDQLDERSRTVRLGRTRPWGPRPLSSKSASARSHLYLGLGS